MSKNIIDKIHHYFMTVGIKGKYFSIIDVVYQTRKHFKEKGKKMFILITSIQYNAESPGQKF